VDTCSKACGQTVEFHIAITIAAAHKIVAASCRINQGTGGELQGVGQLPAWIGQVFERRGIERRRSVCVAGIDNRSFRIHFHYFIGVRDSEREIDGLLLPQP